MTFSGFWTILRLLTSVGVCLCLFCFWLSGGVFQLIWVIFWDARAAWGCSRVFLETLFMKDSVRLELTHQLGPTLKGKILFTWRFWDIKISKPDYLPLPKMIEFCHFFYFSCLSEKNYNLQSFWITLYCVFVSYFFENIVYCVYLECPLWLISLLHLVTFSPWPVERGEHSWANPRWGERGGKHHYQGGSWY